MNTGLLVTAAIAGGGAVLVLLGMWVAAALNVNGFRGSVHHYPAPEPVATPVELPPPATQHVTSVRLDLAPAAHQEVAS